MNRLEFWMDYPFKSIFQRKTAPNSSWPDWFCSGEQPCRKRSDKISETDWIMAAWPNDLWQKCQILKTCCALIKIKVPKRDFRAMP